MGCNAEMRGPSTDRELLSIKVDSFGGTLAFSADGHRLTFRPELPQGYEAPERTWNATPRPEPKMP